jgi:lipopolysaccharide biosynthesis protein
MRKLGIRRVPIFSKFPAGSMYWFRPEIFSQQVIQNLSTLNFQDEFGQYDGTMAHGFERIVGVLVHKSKYLMVGHNFEASDE